jgi:hypothetical protein
MRTRLRLGAAAAVGLGALLLATVLASPALAWHSNVTAEAKCLDDGQIQVDYTVTAWEAGHEAYVKVFYQLNGGEKVDLDAGKFDKEHSEFKDNFVLPEGTTGTVVVTAKAFWKDDQTPSENSSGPVELPEKCKGHESSTSTSESTTSTSESTTSTSESTTTTTTPSTTETSIAPTTSIEETTTTAAVGAATSTTAGAGQLPFTGASSGPMLLAGIVLVGGGSLFLLLSRSRDGHATK